MKTNSKIVKKNIRGYINSCIEEGETIASLYEKFKREKVHQYELKNASSYQQLFIDWLRGLPSDFNIDFVTHKQIEVLENAGLMQPDNKSDIDSVDLFYKLIYREFSFLLKKESGIIFGSDILI